MSAGNMLFQERALTSCLFEQAGYELNKSPLAKLDNYHHHFNLEFDTSHASCRDIQVDINMESTVVFLNPASHHDSHNFHEQYLFSTVVFLSPASHYDSHNLHDSCNLHEHYLFSTINFKANFFFDKSQNHNSDIFNVDHYCHLTIDIQSKHYYTNVCCIKSDFITPRLIQVYFANVHINLCFCFDNIFSDLNYIESATTDVFFGFSFIFDKILYHLALHILILDKYNLHNSYTYKCHPLSLEYFDPALVQKHFISYFDLIIYHTRCNHTIHNYLDALDPYHKSSYDFEHIACLSSNHSPGHSLYLRSYDSFYHNTYYRTCRTFYHRPYHEVNNTNNNSNNNSDNNSNNSNNNNNSFHNLHSLYESFHISYFNKHTIYNGPFSKSAFNASSDAPTTSNDFTAITNSAFSYIVFKQFFSK
ncbi:hypothetical protein UCDDS831_g09269 [Diplodia seriata]|uniref:Uncharacterized protein n=1 Tax=Diplodia seriata TaxID=420778 RepID=A0A0G2DR12_9PEZI|nr:hypothetical protein UCDDS831_g09269 [Diplodia seriata]